MIPCSFSFFPGWKFCLSAFLAMCVFSGGTGADAGHETVLDATLLNYSRSSQNLSLCAVVFDEEFEDAERAELSQAGVAQADMLIREGGWTQEEVVRAYDAVLEQDFSFTLPLDMTWSTFRRAHFTRDFCDRTLAQVAGQGG